MTSPDAYTDAADLAASVARQVPGLDPVWRQAIADVPRHVFLPDRIWVDGTAVDKGSDPGTWWKAAYDDEPVTTAVDGSPGRETWGTSSASQPTVVARMLRFLDPREAGPFLEIGAGTGWNAALIAYATGAEVTSIEIDPNSAESARRSCAAVGVKVEIVTGDGSFGHPDGAPYGCVMATCAAYGVPHAWVEQTRVGGTIVLPWDSPWVGYGTVVLTKRHDGGAEGRFAGFGAFMPLRHGKGYDHALPDVHPDAEAHETTGTLPPWAVKADEPDAAFAVGVQLPGYRFLSAHSTDPEPGAWCCATRVIDPTGANWADVLHDRGADEGPFRVAAHGARNVWADIEAAHAWWTAAGKPTPDRFGLTVDPEGTQRVWFDEPEGRSWPLPAQRTVM